ncbi:hypothetical protein CIK04_29755, partial [Vibrio sp. 03_296]
VEVEIEFFTCPIIWLILRVMESCLSTEINEIPYLINNCIETCARIAEITYNLCKFAVRYIQ